MTRHPLVAALVEARKQRGWSQAALAFRLRRSQKAISYVESGPGASQLLVVEEMARALGLRLALVPVDVGQASDELREAS